MPGSLTLRLTTMALLAGLLGACATTVDPITTKRGRDGFVVNCNNPEGWASCHDAAAEACDGRYRVLERKEHIKRLVVECRKSQRYDYDND